jgi:hypothetical protein
VSLVSLVENMTSNMPQLMGASQLFASETNGGSGIEIAGRVFLVVFRTTELGKLARQLDVVWRYDPSQGELGW